MTCILLNCIVKKLKNELAVRKLQNLALRWFNKHWLKFTGITPKKLHIPTSTMNVSIKKVITPIKKVLIHLNILSLLIIFACGSDTVNNVVTPPVSNDTAIYTLDSFAIRSNAIGVTNNIIARSVLTNFDSLKITFDCSTNLTNDSTTIGMYLNDSVSTFFSVPKPHTINHVIYWRQHHLDTLSFSIYLRLYNSENLPKYLKISNFKIYRIS